MGAKDVPGTTLGYGNALMATGKSRGTGDPVWFLGPLLTFWMCFCFWASGTHSIAPHFQQQP